LRYNHYETRRQEKIQIVKEERLVIIDEEA